jgi:hypothetical protein
MRPVSTSHTVNTPRGATLHVLVCQRQFLNGFQEFLISLELADQRLRMRQLILFVFYIDIRTNFLKGRTGIGFPEYFAQHIRFPYFLTTHTVGVLNLFRKIGTNTRTATTKPAGAIHRFGHFFATNGAIHVIHFIEDPPR